MEAKIYGVVYGIECLVNYKIYVGQTVRPLKERISQHKYCKTSIIGRAIHKYGWEGNFAYVVLEECYSREQLNECEMKWIKTLNSKYPNGYNITDGGEGAAGRKHTEEEIRKLVLVNTGRKLSEEAKAKISAFHKGNKYWLGKTHTEATKMKISASNKGKHFDRIGKKDSAETRARKSATQMGNTKGRGNKGIPKKDEQKVKISATLRKVLYPNLDAELIKQSLTYRELARHLGIARETLGGKLRGKHRLDEKTAQAIKDLLNVDMPLEELFKRNDS